MRECIIDLSKTSNETVDAEPVRISTVTLSTGDYYRGICMAGGFGGEYALKDLLYNAKDQSVIVGHATRASYGIINHVDIDCYAHGNEYRAVMACNGNTAFWMLRRIHSSVIRVVIPIPLFARASYLDTITHFQSTVLLCVRMGS
jgi:hypothetical protein